MFQGLPVSLKTGGLGSKGSGSGWCGEVGESYVQTVSNGSYILNSQSAPQISAASLLRRKVQAT